MACGPRGFTHGYYNAATTQCFCSGGTPFQQYLVTGDAGACGSNYDNRVTKTTFMAWDPPCYDTRPGGITVVPNYTPTGLNGCLVRCGNSLQATFWAAVSA